MHCQLPVDDTALFSTLLPEAILIIDATDAQLFQRSPISRKRDLLFLSFVFGCLFLQFTGHFPLMNQTSGATPRCREKSPSGAISSLQP